MSNDKKILTSFCPSVQNTVIKMWILFEGDPNPTKLKADISEVKDLDDLKYIPKNEIEILKDVKPPNIIFFDCNDCIKSIRPDTLLKPLADNKTAISPLIVRYPVSDSSSKYKICLSTYLY